jgi:hypothetical protein
MSYIAKIEVSNVSKPGSQGFQGWSPVPSIFVDGTRHVIRIVDWVGGLGPKPSLANQFVGLTGLVSTAAAAVDIRGASEIGDVVFTNMSTMVLKNRTTYLANGAGTTFSFPALSTAGFEFDLINNHQFGASLAIPAGAVLRKPSSRSLGTAFESVSWVIDNSTSFTFPVGIFKVKTFVASGIILIYIF